MWTLKSLHHTQIKGGHSGEPAHNSIITFRLLSKRKTPNEKEVIMEILWIFSDSQKAKDN